LPSDGLAVNQPIMIATCHVHWDPEFCDVKLIQTMMLMHKLQSIIKNAQQTSMKSNGGGGGAGSNDKTGTSNESNSGINIPLILCGDLNSLPESGLHNF